MILHYPLLPDFDEKSQSDIVYYTIYASLHSNLQQETRKRTQTDQEADGERNISDCTINYLIIMFLVFYACIHAHSVMSHSLQPQGP